MSVNENDVQTEVSTVDPKGMSTKELLAEYDDVTSRLANSSRLAGWLVGRLESRKIQLAVGLAEKMKNAQIKGDK
ncbi:MAG: hypothetical protein ABIF19_12930 [Planctomycetota bacterium]